MWAHRGKGAVHVSVREINNELGHCQGSCFIHYNQGQTAGVQSMRSGVQLWAMYVCGVKVYACALCLRVSFMCAWVSSGRQELAPQRNACVYAMCFAWERLWVCTYTYILYLHMQRWISVYLGCSMNRYARLLSWGSCCVSSRDKP